MSEPIKIVGIILGLCVGALVLDYACYYQATIFTTLDGSGKGMDAEYRNPRYHPFAHPILWALMGVIAISVFMLVALNVGGEVLAWLTALAFGAFFFARYLLMRRGIS